MGPTSPTRIDDELYASAKAVGQLMSRSAAQQMAHWARIGRELEAAASVSHGDVAEVLAARQEYDTLTTHEQTVVRAEWAERMNARREALDLAREFSDQGRPYVELEEKGQVARRERRRHRGQRWPDATAEHAYEAAELAAADNARCIAEGQSFARSASTTTAQPLNRSA